MTPPGPPTPPWTLAYADGAANVYRFEAEGDEAFLERELRGLAP